jgi:hypothetical protein
MFKAIDNYLNFDDESLGIIDKYRLRFSFIFSLCFIVFITTIIIPKVFFIQAVNLTSLTSGVLALPIIYTLIKLPHRKGIIAYRWVLLLTSMILIPLFAIEIKNHSWSLITWLILLFKCIRFEFNFKLAFIVTVTNATAVVFGIFFSENINPIFESVPFRIYLHFIPPILFIMIMDFFETLLRDDLIKEIKEKEELHTIDNMVTTLKHKINNPLTLSLASIYRLKKNPANDAKELQSCEDGLKRIQKLVSEISNLKEHRQKIKLSHSTMYDLNEHQIDKKPKS